MSEFVQLPWLNSSDQFLQAMIAGGQVGLQRQKMQLDANQFNAQMNRPEGSRGGGGGGGGSEFDPLRQAQADAITQKSKMDAEEAAAKKAANDRYTWLMDRGATDKEAYDQSGLKSFGVPETRPDTIMPFEGVNLGQGGVGRFNRQTGKFEIVNNQTPKNSPASINEWSNTLKDADGKYFQVNKKTGEKRYVTEPITPETQPTSEIPGVVQPGGGFWNGVSSALNPFASEPGAASTETPTWNNGMPWQNSEPSPASGTLRFIRDADGNLVQAN